LTKLQSVFGNFLRHSVETHKLAISPSVSHKRLSFSTFRRKISGIILITYKSITIRTMTLLLPWLYLITVLLLLLLSWHLDQN